MKLDVALLAEAAVTFDGKLWVHGGGVTEIDAPVIPWTQPQLAIAVRLAANVDETQRSHKFAIWGVRPDGAMLFPRSEVPVDPPGPPPPPRGERYLNLALTLSPVTFHEEGLHHIEIEVDGEVLRSLELHVFRSDDYELVVEDATVKDVSPDVSRTAENPAQPSNTDTTP